MKTQALNVPAGKLFYFTKGEYSDFNIIGTFLALVPLNKEVFEKFIEELPEYAKTWLLLGDERFETAAPGHYDNEYLCRNCFIPGLIRMGYIMDIDTVAIHTGDFAALTLS